MLRLKEADFLPKGAEGRQATRNIWHALYRNPRLWLLWAVMMAPSTIGAIVVYHADFAIHAQGQYGRRSIRERRH